MNARPTIRRELLDQLLDEHRQLIRLANELEFHLYQLGDAASPEHIRECQQAAGNLIGLLRTNLFRHDQEVLPLLESLLMESLNSRSLANMRQNAPLAEH